jgi:hypothetical protein
MNHISKSVLTLLDSIGAWRDEPLLGAAIDYRIASYPTLIEAMRDRDSRALRELLDRLLPLALDALLGAARRQHGDRLGLRCEDAANDAVVGVVLGFLDRARPVPEAFEAYVLGAAKLRTRQYSALSFQRAQLAEAAGVSTSFSQATCRTGEGGILDDPATAPDVWQTIDASDRDLERRAGIEALLTPDDIEIMTWLGEGVPRATIAEWIGISSEMVSARIETIRKRATRVVTVGRPAMQVRSFLTKSDARDLVSAFVASRPAADRVPMATALRGFADANGIGSVPTAIHKLLTRGTMIAARMIEKDNSLTTRRAIAQLTTFARENGYVDVPGRLAALGS